MWRHSFWIRSTSQIYPGLVQARSQAIQEMHRKQLHRARIVITPRPIPFYEQLVREILPAPPAHSSEPGKKAFAKITMRGHQKKCDDKEARLSPELRPVAWMSLSDEQIIEFSRDRGANDPELLLEDLKAPISAFVSIAINSRRISESSCCRTPIDLSRWSYPSTRQLKVPAELRSQCI